MLRDRRDECAALDRLLADAKAGSSQVLVLRGEAGIGKSALVEHLVESAAGYRIARAADIESEMTVKLPLDGGGVVVGEKVQINLEIEAVLRQA